MFRRSCLVSIFAPCGWPVHCCSSGWRRVSRSRHPWRKQRSPSAPWILLQHEGPHHEPHPAQANAPAQALSRQARIAAAHEPGGGESRGSRRSWFTKKASSRRSSPVATWATSRSASPQHPRVAADLGLGALSQALRQHAGYAKHHGWAASLVSELTAHPRYAERPSPHGGPQCAAVPDIEPGQPPASTVTTTTGHLTDQHRRRHVADADHRPDRPVARDSRSAVGRRGRNARRDAAQPRASERTTSRTRSRPQPLPANMTFNRETGELTFVPTPAQTGVTELSVAVSNGSRSGTILLPVTVTNPLAAHDRGLGAGGRSKRQPAGRHAGHDRHGHDDHECVGRLHAHGHPGQPRPDQRRRIRRHGAGPARPDGARRPALGPRLFTERNNVMPSPADLAQDRLVGRRRASARPSATQPLTITNPAMPGFSMQMPAEPPPGVHRRRARSQSPSSRPRSPPSTCRRG